MRATASRTPHLCHPPQPPCSPPHPRSHPQVASYWLSYLNCRSTRSIGLPVPLHYARLAAARGQCFMSHSAAAGQGASAATTTTSPSPCSSFSGLHQQLASTMFFA